MTTDSRNPKGHSWLYKVIIIVCLLLLVPALGTVYYYSSLLQQAKIMSVTATGYDAETNQPLTSFGAKLPSTGQQMLPKDFRTTAISGNTLSIQWIGTGQVEIEFIADGYRPKKMTVGSDKDSSIKVYLKEKAKQRKLEPQHP